MTPEERFNQFQADLAALTYNDIKDVTIAQYVGWLAVCGTWVKEGGAVPPHKPGTNG